MTINKCYFKIIFLQLLNFLVDYKLSPSPCFVYVIGSLQTNKIDNVRTYVGWTNDLEKRIKRHNDGSGAKSTRGRKWQLLYVEVYNSRGDAMSREWKLKRDRKFRKQLINNWVN